MITIQNLTTNPVEISTGIWLPPGVSADFDTWTVSETNATDGHVYYTEAGPMYAIVPSPETLFSDGFSLGLTIFGAAIIIYLFRRAFLAGDLVD